MTPEERLSAAEALNGRLLDMAIKHCLGELSLMGDVEDEARANNAYSDHADVLTSLYISDAIDEACRRNRVGMYALMDELGISDGESVEKPVAKPPLHLVT